jgi:penicillin-binding protein 1A
MRRWLVIGVVAALAAAACSVEPLPDPGMGENALTTTVYAADGSVLAQWHAGENRTLVSYEDIPRSVLDAVVAIEDERFWEHSGVDLRAMIRALVRDLEAGEVVEGGSTITQQYLKNVLLSSEVTVDRKLQEAVLALRLEEGLPKEEILERYLNTAYFGHGAYGIGTAAATYFGKEVGELTLGEAALLAGVIHSPGASDPFQNPDAALERRGVVLDKMLELGWVDVGEAEAARAEPLQLVSTSASDQVRYPHFVEEVKRRLLDDTRLAPTQQERYDLLFRGGLQIHTTLDPDMQDVAEAAVDDILPDDGPSAALVALDPRTGHVLAMVGGRDFYDAPAPSAQFNLATQGRRQPGSAFKPFVLAAAAEQGHQLDEMREGGQSVTIVTPSGPWVVDNYNDSVFPDLTLLEATVFSVNVVFARLIDEVGAEAVAEAARAAGITSDLVPLHSLALGAEEVSVLEMASAYGTFAAEGVHVDPIMVTSIEDSDGVNVYEAVPVVTDAFDRSVAREVTAALTEVVRRGTGQQSRIGRTTAGKTGTSQQHHDAWFVGYTGELVAAVWVGFPDAQIPLEYPATPYTITGGTWPAQIWAGFASAALAGVPYGEMATADTSDLVTVEVDLSTGFLAGPLCPREYVQRIEVPADLAPTLICPVHNPADLSHLDTQVTPDLIGLDLASALELLALTGQGTTVTWADGDPLPAGTVFGQDPPPGAEAVAGTSVRLTVAGPEPGTTVPAVLGLPRAVAEQRLEEASVTPTVVVEAESDPEDAARRAGLVWKQDPAAGASNTVAVTIWVNP